MINGIKQQAIKDIRNVDIVFKGESATTLKSYSSQQKDWLGYDNF